MNQLYKLVVPALVLLIISLPAFFTPMQPIKKVPEQSVEITHPQFASHNKISNRQLLHGNRTLVKRYFNEVWNEGKLEVLDELLAPNYLNHTPSIPNPLPGPQGLKPIIIAIRKAYPDLHFQIQDIIATNDKVVARVVMTGTHSGELFGLQPTGKKIRVNQINIEHIHNGKITEHWRVTDELNMMKQLGQIK